MRFITALWMPSAPFMTGTSCLTASREMRPPMYTGLYGCCRLQHSGLLLTSARNTRRRKRRRVFSMEKPRKYDIIGTEEYIRVLPELQTDPYRGNEGESGREFNFEAASREEDLLNRNEKRKGGTERKRPSLLFHITCRKRSSLPSRLSGR